MPRPKLTQEQFIQKAKAIHGDKYDFSKSVYSIGNNTVCVICPIHGEFQIRAYKLLEGVGCRACARSPQYDTDSFITAARKVHGDNYDYSLVKFTRMKDKVNIICKKHGVFTQTASKHVNGKQGCPVCAKEIRTTKEWFIEQSRLVHGDRYDYSKVVYLGVEKKVEILCNIHGSFWTTPELHMRGKNCPKCAQRHNYTTEEYITKCKEVHGDKYDYSKTKYTIGADKVEIVCKEHGSFLQEASKHLQGRGCSLCSSQAPLTTDVFIERCKEIHGDKYQYDKTIYNRSHQKVIVYCVHCKKYFKQEANAHMRGVGCPICSGSKAEYQITTWLDAHKIKYKAEQTFPDCRDKGILMFDFCIYNKDGTIKTLLEYDGLQHFKASDFYGGEKALTLTQYHDAIKNQYCEDHKIPLIRIPYWDKDKIPEILQKHIGDDI